MRLAQDILFLYSTIFHSDIGTYNDMKNQTGFCKMTGFNTISRNTSYGPDLFTSGRVQFGVGLSQFQFGSNTIMSVDKKTQGQLVCGMCINITGINNLPKFNFELDSHEKVNEESSYIAMIFDQCTDPICTSGFLDIDVYDDNIFSNGNTNNITWTAIDCPTYENEKREYLLCSKDTCNKQNTKYINVNTFGELFDPTFFNIIVRNMKRPIKNLYIFVNGKYEELEYVSGNGYTWYGEKDEFKETQLKIKLIDYLDNIYFDKYNLNDILNLHPTVDYTGGVIFS